MFFGWHKRIRRRRLKNQLFPEEWTRVLNRNVYVYSRLNDLERMKLRDDLRVLVMEKNWEGCGGLEMSDEIKVTIAAQASLLVLGFEEEYFDAVQSILVYPNAYIAPDRVVTAGGVVLEGESHREGEAWYRGPVILSWADAIAAGRQESEGHNVVLHEFAHQLDMQNGQIVDGTPLLASREQFHRWQEVIRTEHERLRRDCAQGNVTLLDCYGASSVGEFFAVSSECFFERSRELLQWHPELYDLLRTFYRQDPVRRN